MLQCVRQALGVEVSGCTNLWVRCSVCCSVCVAGCAAVCVVVCVAVRAAGVGG